MAERIVRRTVTFAEPFLVEGREHPAGSYEVELVEEPIGGLSFLAYRLVSASIALPLPAGGPHSYQLVPIDRSLVPAALREAGAA